VSTVDAEFREARARLEQYRQIMEMLRAAVETDDDDRIAWTARRAVRSAAEVES